MSRRQRSSEAAFSLFAFQDIITAVTGIMILVTMILALELVHKKQTTPAKRTERITSDLTVEIEYSRARIEDLEGLIPKLQDRAIEFSVHDADEVRRRITALDEEIKNAEADTSRLQSDHREARQIEGDTIDVETIQEDLANTQRTLEELRDSKRVFLDLSKGDSKSAWLVQIQGDRFLIAQAGKKQRPESFRTFREFERFARKQSPHDCYFVLLVKHDGIDNFRNANKELKQLGFELGLGVLNAGDVAVDPEHGAGIE